MEDWDQEKLESVVASKGTEYKNANKPTEIVRSPQGTPTPAPPRPLPLWPAYSLVNCVPAIPCYPVVSCASSRALHAAQGWHQGVGILCTAQALVSTQKGCCLRCWGLSQHEGGA